MSTLTTLVSLFHNDDHARQALSDLQAAAVPQQSIEVLKSHNATASPDQALSSLQSLNLPERDVQVLSSGLRNGGTIVVVRAEAALVPHVEDVFEKYNAGKIDERGVQSPPAASAGATTGDAVIPIMEEELTIGKRSVERGGVRVFSRVIERPVEENVYLREEHASFERHAVDRAISEAELAQMKDQTVEIREMGEEAVVGKTARVVEEVHIVKETTERTQAIHETLRRTHIDIEQVELGLSNSAKGGK